jgi:4-diphosphocytidyl-2-C-methyl-D-erythritol kinase
MPLTVRSFAKINLGLAIGPLRPDGFHELRTIYQTIALHDIIRVSVTRGAGTNIDIRCPDPRVPKDESNTCHRIVERAMSALKARGRVIIEIEKRLPVQGGLGGASGNAIATLLALERVLKKSLPDADKLRIAADVGSDVPLFLIGGTVLGVGRGEEVYPLPDLPLIPCVIATPDIAVSTPKAFAAWDACGAGALAREAAPPNQSDLSVWGGHDFSRATNANPRVASAAKRRHSLAQHVSAGEEKAEQNRVPSGTALSRDTDSGAIAREPSALTPATASDRLLMFSRRMSAWLNFQGNSGRASSGVPAGKRRGRAETPLLDLVRAGIENDFEQVVFPQYPELREVKRVLELAGAFYASLSGSGAAIYGLFASREKAGQAAVKLVKMGIPAVATATLTRRQYLRKFLVAGS